jgi:nitrite reductase/ring-hydroxylating ferredoxin subunit
MRSGWYQVAFERELKDGVNPIAIERPLVAVRGGGRVRVFDAVCPHRGAHLGHGGIVEGEAIVCPFHARRIGMGTSAPFAYCVAEYETISIGGMVFTRLSTEDTGAEKETVDLPSILQRIDRDHYYIPGLVIKAPVPAELVIENGFDDLHFQPVHAVCAPPCLVVVSNSGRELRAEGMFVVPSSLWQNGGTDVVSVPYTARCLSPGIILSHMGGDNPYHVLTAATPLARTECVIRVSIAVSPGLDGAAPDRTRCEYVLAQSRKGLERDLEIWRNLNLDAASSFAPEDAAVIAFRQFVARFPVVS